MPRKHKRRAKPQTPKKPSAAKRKAKRQALAAGARVTLTHPKVKAYAKGWTLERRQGGKLVCKHTNGAVVAVAPQYVRRANPATAAEITEAKRAYEEFHWGNKSTGGRKVRSPGAKGALMAIGKVHAIAYETIKGGEHAVWEHEFAEDGGTQPTLAVDKHKKLHILGGTYSVRKEGIVG